MFFNAIYRLSLWKDLDNKSRNIRILILGAVLYIIIHSFIYSNYVESIEIIEQYRDYLYYLIGIDLIFVGIQMFIGDDGGISKKKKKKKTLKRKHSIKMNPYMLQNMKINQMNQMNQMNKMNQMNQMNQLNNLNKINQVNQVNKIGQTKQQQQQQVLMHQTIDDSNSISIPIYTSNSHIINWNNNAQQPQQQEQNDMELPIYGETKEDITQNEYINNKDIDSIPIYHPNMQFI